MTDRLAPLGYYKWHWQTWRANRKVQRMNYIERGLYRELLDECWAEGFIPDDIEKLADICGCPVDVLANAWQVLSKCFANAGNGFLYNERLEQERTDMDKTRANRARAGAAGGRAKASNGAALDGNCQANASNSLANASKSHIEEKRREEKKDNGDFDLFWEFALTQYRRCDSKPGNKKEAEKEWNKLGPDSELQADMRTALEAQAEARINPSEFVANLKHVCRWIKNECWNDVQAEDDEDPTPLWMKNAL